MIRALFTPFKNALRLAQPLRRRAGGSPFALGRRFAEQPPRVDPDVQERIMELLTRLEEMFAIEHPKGRLLVTQLTHEQIAAMTGTSRVTVTRTLQRLREQGRISILEGHILLMGKRPPG